VNYAIQQLTDRLKWEKLSHERFIAEANSYAELLTQTLEYSTFTENKIRELEDAIAKLQK
jgi:hypothetical protein